MNDKNRRRNRRIPQAQPVRIAWEDRGEHLFAIARCIDISEQGMRIELAPPVSRGARIMIAAESIKFAGSASVRYVGRTGCKSVLGVEFVRPIETAALSALEGR
jgi:hypothetical protein